MARYFEISTIPLNRPCEVTGFDGKRATPLTYTIKLNLTVDGRQVPDTPFLILDGRHDIILGRMGFAKHGVLLNCQYRQLV
jgi:hypothetical protein